MKRLAYTSLFLAAAFAATNAFALTIVNRDAEDVEITVVEGTEEQSFVLAPDESISDVCLQQCVVIAGDGEGEEQSGEGTLAVIGGQLVREE